ncbi:SRPBCC family protein [Antrihabitans sp. YC3-6]|uniref:SRPBCC family protein n=1 Tax=Antrihabitans stalagmiti TaxID=2799499 RepID=A0A934NX20_9NOCA|nr:SRPBCC family protein [Antrihabitans stalagmiti]MBJ8342833.1 SRPBCC family protein [Antrihabitans stalagmiti]
MASYTVDTVIEAPRDVVYSIFADRENNGDFLPISTRLKSAGTTERQGVGAVHFLGLGPVGVSEQIIDLVPGERIVYKIVAGAPVKRHVGTIAFTDAANGTRVVYTMESEPKLPVPSKVLSLGLKALIGAFVSGARKEAAKRA